MLNIAKLCAELAPKITGLRNLSCSPMCAIDQKWRDDKGLAANPNSFGPLTNLPDYSFLDGRPTPLGSNQKRRLQKQQEIAAKILTLNNELHFAKERHTRIKAEKAAEKQRIEANKLKPKGHLLLKTD